MTTVGNIGIGLLILIIVWIIALIFFVISVHQQSNLGWIGLGAATVLTLILTLIPIEDKSNNLNDLVPEEKDYSQIYKYLLLGILTTCAILSFLVFFLGFCIQLRRPKAHYNVHF